jgi:hypothetical protein
VGESVVSGRRPAGVRDRRHQRPGRPRQLKLRLSESEFAELVEAAVDAGLTPSGYAAEAALAAARGTRPSAGQPWRAALGEVMAARAQVRRFGVNVNQAVRVLNATGEAPEWLRQAVETTEQAVLSLDEAAGRLAGQRRRSNGAGS